MSIIGLKTIYCFIKGNCYNQVWYFIFIFIFINIIFIGYQNEFEKRLPKLSQKIENKQKQENNFRKTILKNIKNKDKILKIKY